MVGEIDPSKKDFLKPQQCFLHVTECPRDWDLLSLVCCGCTSVSRHTTFGRHGKMFEKCATMQYTQVVKNRLEQILKKQGFLPQISMWGLVQFLQLVTSSDLWRHRDVSARVMTQEEEKDPFLSWKWRNTTRQNWGFTVSISDSYKWCRHILKVGLFTVQ